MSRVRPHKHERAVVKYLQANGLDPRVEMGSKHRKVYVGQRLFMVLSNNNGVGNCTADHLKAMLNQFKATQCN